MADWRRTYRGVVRRVRKRHPLQRWVHFVWLLPFTCAAWFYYHLYDLVDGGWWSMAYFLGLQVAYFYLVAFVLLPFGYHVKHVGRSVALQAAMLVFAFVLFALTMVIKSIIGHTIEISLDFSGEFRFNIVNFGEMVFLFLGMSPSISACFFYIERYLIGKRMNRRLWLLYADARARISVLNDEWLAWQMQPHLMGNLMTTLRDAARSERPVKLVRATNYVDNLMGFYTRIAKSLQLILLKDEIRQASVLLAIHKLAATRGGAARHVRLVIADALPEVAVLPMTVLVLVENIFRHATRIDKRHPATVEMAAVPGGVRIVAENAYDPLVAAAGSSKGNGVAIRNIRQRLRNAHPKATLQTVQADGRFRVIIFIPTDFIPLP